MTSGLAHCGHAPACDHDVDGRRWSDRVNDDRGATAVEYALIVTAIAGLIIAIVFVLGGKTADLFGKPCNELATATATASC